MDDMKHSRIWSPISPLPQEWKELASDELASLAPIWTEQSEKLKGGDALTQFHEKLKREWAIETGIIEGLYSIDRGTTELLIEKGLETSLLAHGSTDLPADEVIEILKDQKEALEGLFDFVSHKRSLSISYIKECHASLTRHQPTTTARDQFGKTTTVKLLRGEWKKTPNNPTREEDGTIYLYCPPEQVASEMERLVEMYNREEENVTPEVLSAWLHHRFTQIHPFQDGNGRVARVLASLIFLRHKWFPLVIRREIRSDYISALEKADSGDLAKLVKLFVRIQKEQFVKAISISERVLDHVVPRSDLMKAGVERLRARLKGDLDRQRKVFSTARAAESYIRAELFRCSRELDLDIKRAKQNYACFARCSDDESKHWYNGDIIETAKFLNYFADTRSYRSWCRLVIREERQTEIVFSTHSLGTEFVGIMAISAFVKFRDSGEDEVTTGGRARVVCESVFQFAFNEEESEVLKRFEKWFDNCLLAGLEEWRLQL